MQLTLFEREVSKESLHARLRTSIGALLNHVRGVFDVVLIDCPPGLSVLTESWLREADFHFSPTKPDYVSTCGLEVFRRFKGLNPEMGFAENLGVIINMKDPHSSVEADYQRWLAENPDNRCSPDRAAHQRAAARLPPEPGGALLRGQISRRFRQRDQIDRRGAAREARRSQRARRQTTCLVQCTASSSTGVDRYELNRSTTPCSAGTQHHAMLE